MSKKQSSMLSFLNLTKPSETSSNSVSPPISPPMIKAQSTSTNDLHTQTNSSPYANDSKDEEFGFDDDNSDGGRAPGSESSHSSDDSHLNPTTMSNAYVNADGMLLYDSDVDKVSVHGSFLAMEETLY